MVIDADNIDESAGRLLLFELCIHHGGKFLRTPRLNYEGGNVSKSDENDNGIVNYEYIMQKVNRLGYELVSKVHYRVPWFRMEKGGLRNLWNDESMIHALEVARLSGVCELFVEHDLVDEPNTDNPPKEVNQTPELETICLSSKDAPSTNDANEQVIGSVGDIPAQTKPNEIDLEAYGMSPQALENAFEDYLCDNMNVGKETENVVIDNEEGLVDVNLDRENVEEGYESSDSDKGSVDSVEVMTDDEELRDVIKEAKNFRKNKYRLLYENVDVEEITEGLRVNESPIDVITNQGPTIGEDVVGDSDQGEVNCDEAWKNDTKDMESAESDYEGEDGNLSPDDESEEDDWVAGYEEDRLKKRRSRKIPYNRNVSIKEFDFCTHMTFDSAEDFKDVVKSYAANGGYPLWFDRNTKNQIQVKCSKERMKISDDPPKFKKVARCPWTIWASYMQDERTFEVKTYINNHVCNTQKKVSVAGSKWLAAKYGDKVRRNPFIKLSQLQDSITDDMGIDVSITRCGRIKKIALSEAEKSLREHYAQMWRYAREVYRANPGSTFFIQTIDRDNPIGPQFKRLYVCFDAVKKGWKAGCRRIIGIDGCFLKTYCTGELLSAVGRDGNDQMYPIAWGIVEVESKESWVWFLTHLIEDLGLEDGHGMTVMSDKQKGLIEAVKQLIPHAEHRKCARHIYANFRQKFPGQAYKAKFWAAAKATTLGEYNKAMHEIKEISEDAYFELTKKSDPHSWSRAFFKTYSRCDSIDNNMSECFNSWILKSRYKPVVDMLEDIRRLVMIRLRKNRDLMLKNQLPFGKRIHTKLNDNITAARRCCRSEWNGDRKYEVQDPHYGTVTVDINSRTCSCRRWDLTDIPCAHAISALGDLRVKPSDYVGKWYKKETYLSSYNSMITPHNGRLLWPEDHRMPIRPPPVRKMPGRPAKKRRREVGEETKKKKKKVKPNHVNNEGDDNMNQPEKVLRRGGHVTCSICKQKGHNKVTCPKKSQQPAVNASDQPVEQRKRKEKGKKQCGENRGVMGTEQRGGNGGTTAGMSSSAQEGRSASSVQECRAAGSCPSLFQGIPIFNKRGRAFISSSSLIKRSLGSSTQ